jgi:hypothetical protein
MLPPPHPPLPLPLPLLPPPLLLLRIGSFMMLWRVVQNARWMVR